MDKGSYKKLNGYHVVFLIVGALVGLSALTLSNDLSVVGYSQCTIILLYGIVSNILLFPMIRISLKYPKNNLFEINEILLGKMIGKVINILIIIYTILIIARASGGYLSLTQTSILVNKEFSLPLLFLFFVMLYIVTGGIKLIARFSIFAFFLSTWMVIAARWPFSMGSLTHLMPMFNFTLKEGMEAFHKGYGAMMGYELIMIYFPFIINQKKAFRHGSIGIWISTGIYFVGVLSCVVYFSPWQLESLRFPLLTVFKVVEYTFIKKVENILSASLMFLILSTMSLYVWAAKKGMDSLFGKRRILHMYLATFVVALLLYITIPIIIESFLFEELLFYLGYGVILWPIFLLAIHGIRRRGGKAP